MDKVNKIILVAPTKDLKKSGRLENEFEESDRKTSKKTEIEF